MIRCVVPSIVLIACGLHAGACPADEFEIRVKAEADGRHVESARTQESPSAKSAARRPVLQLECNQTLWISWHAQNASKSRSYPDVLMHVFVVEEPKLGQAEVPKLTEDVPYEGALTMDFNSHDAANWRMSLRMPEPGNYLVRVETIGMAKTHGHEHFAAVDLVVKRAGTRRTGGR